MKSTLSGGIFSGLMASVLMAEVEQIKPERKGPKDQPQGEQDAIFRRMDQDGDEKISKREFFASPRISQLPEDKREEIFVRLDRDSDGFLTRREIHAMRHDAERRVREGFQKLDTDKSGGLSFEEFSKGEFASKLPQEKRRQIFDRMDTDGDGEINSADRPRAIPGKPERKFRD